MRTTHLGETALAHHNKYDNIKNYFKSNTFKTVFVGLIWWLFLISTILSTINVVSSNIDRQSKVIYDVTSLK